MALSKAHRSIVWIQQAFVVELLESANAYSTECQQTLASNLFKAAISNSGPGARIGEQARSESEVTANARRIMTELLIASPARRFYRGLAEHAEHMIHWLSSPRFD